MNKKQALITLVKHTRLFSEKSKAKILSNVDNFSEEDIEKLGKFLALEKKQSLERNKELISEIDLLLEKING
jgi:hypothetical protein